MTGPDWSCSVPSSDSVGLSPLDKKIYIHEYLSHLGYRYFIIDIYI